MLCSNLAPVIAQLGKLAHIRPNDTGFIFVQDRYLHDEAVSYSELWTKVGVIATALAHQGCLRGDRVLLVYPSGLEYIAAFFGCLAAGAIAVPVYPPASEQHLERLRKVIDDCRPAVVLTQTSECARLDRLLDELGGVTPRVCCTDELSAVYQTLLAKNRVEASDVALLQYTSGSTDHPKGVVITHGNLSANQRFINRAFSGERAGVGLGWLPLYHDMGLIGCVIQSVFWGYPYVFMSPLTFMQHPAVWLRAITKYQAVRSGGPSFAYELCASRIGSDQMEGIDLTNWQIAFCGSEQIRHRTLQRFADHFAQVGFDARSFLPCYGLAEATLFVSGSKSGSGLLLHTPELGAHASTETAHQGFVGCGEVAPELNVRIVDPETQIELPMGQIGEVWVQGANVAQGYWQQPELSRSLFDAQIVDHRDEPGYLRTGDLGFLRNGELVIAGRLKEILIVGGRNLYPQDIETLAEAQSPALRPGHTAAVALNDEATEGLAIVAEVNRADRFKTNLNDLAGRIVAAIVTAHGVAPRKVIFLSPGRQLKTSSGKLRRTEIGRLLAAHSLSALYTWPSSTSGTLPQTEDTAGVKA